MLHHAREWEERVVNGPQHYGRRGRTCIQAAVNFSMHAQSARLHARGFHLTFKRPLSELISPDWFGLRAVLVVPSSSSGLPYACIAYPG
eukprot:6473292-Amphidinium_carterae.1